MFHINGKGKVSIMKLVNLVFLVLICLNIVYGQELSVKIIPERVALGGTITIKIKPETSFYNILYVYKIDGTYITSIKIDCEEQCSEEKNINFVIPSDWEAGNYYIEIFDYSKGDYLKRGFAVALTDCTKYVSTTGSGSACSSDNPCSLNYAKQNAIPGNVICLRPGNYGSVTIDDGFGSAEGGYVTYKADPATTATRPSNWYEDSLNRPDSSDSVIFSQLKLDYTMCDANYNTIGGHYIEFNGINIIGYAYLQFCVSYLRLINCNIFGHMGNFSSETSNYGIYFRHYAGFGSDFHDVLIEGCYIEKNDIGIMLQGNNNGNIVFRGNHIHDIIGTGISLQSSGNKITVVEGNHINKQNSVADTLKHTCNVITPDASEPNRIFTIDCSPTWYDSAVVINPITGDRELREVESYDSNTKTITLREALSFNTEAGDTIELWDDSHGSGISIRSRYLNITHNKIHDVGTTRGIYLYIDNLPNITLEYNLVYDIMNQYTVDFSQPYKLGSNSKIRHNTFVGHKISSNPERRYGFAAMLGISESADPLTIDIEDNIFVGIASGHGSANVVHNILYDGWGYEEDSVGNNRENLVYYDGESLGSEPWSFHSSEGFFLGGAGFDAGLDSRHGKNFNDYFYPLITSDACNGNVNGQPGVAIGALPCICTENSQCEQVFGGGYICNIESGNCVEGEVVVVPENLRTKNISQYGITWTFDKEYEYGTFANGDYWVVPDTPGGSVTIIRIDPASQEIYGTWWDESHEHSWTGNRTMDGSMVNPSPGSGKAQGYDSEMYSWSPNSGRVYGGNYNPALNVARPNGENLSASNPLVLQSNSSLISSISLYYGSRPQLKTAAVLTVLAEAPPENSFRPPYVGTDKPFYNVNQLMPELLPSLEPTPDTPSLDSIKTQFQKVQLDHVVEWPGRHIHPTQNMPGYGADIAKRNAVGALRLMLNDTIDDKMPALINYVQMGLDFYGILKNGGYWPGAGGHGEGRKLPIAFAAVLLDDQEMKDAVSEAGIDSDIFGENKGVEFSQKANNGGGMALYAQTYDGEYNYWINLADPSASGGRTNKDPHGYIDGGEAPGVTYLSPALSQTWKATSIAVRLMPEVRSVWNDEYFHDFSDRYAGFGIWAQPDPCAPPTGECNTTKIPCTLANKSCPAGEYCDIASKFSTDYGVKYGPDPNNPGNCILDTDSSDGIGRSPKSHGKNKDFGLRGSTFANNMWDAYRKIYSCVWTYDEINNWHYDCSQCLYNCLTSPYCGDGFCNGDENPETCLWDCPCTEGEQRLCEKQSGICDGSKENCINNEWFGCDSSIYLNWNSNYEETEVSCGDGYDNDCDDCTDIVDSNCGGIETSCFDGIDNDCDSLTDCQDSDCRVGTETDCFDRVDNDCDGWMDCIDIDCKETEEDCLPVSWYMFEGNANDERGVNDGTLMNDAGIVSDAERGNVLGLDGSGDYVAFSQQSLTSNWTICAWTKASTGTRIVLGDKDTSHSYFYLSPGVRAWFENPSGTTTKWDDDTDFTEWRHVVLVATDTTVELYLDGVSQGVKTITATFDVDAIGRGRSDGYYDYKGTIDDVMIYNRILIKEEIQHIYCSQGGNASFCQALIKTCSQQSGYICSDTEYCSGNKITASDTERCCDVPCITPSWDNCSECGSGLFNICDKDECHSILEGCYYEGGFVCLPCSGVNCSDYNDEADCTTDKCGKNCGWDGSSCVEIIPCTNDIGCSSEGHFCDNNLVYNCSLGSDGCLDRINITECESGKICQNGDCVALTINKTNQISQYGITWYFDKEYEYGTFVNGDYWVVGPVNITNIEPKFAFDIIYTDEYCRYHGGASDIVKCANFPPLYQGEYNYKDFCVDYKCVYVIKRNGFMINPMPGSQHLYDSRAAQYNLDDSSSLPLDISVNSSIISTISLPESATTWSKLETAAILTVLDSPPPAGSFRPGYAGEEKKLYSSQDLKRELLPSLSPVGSPPTLASMESWFQRPWIDHLRGWSGHDIFPTENMPGYGSDICTRIGVGTLGLMIDYPLEDKETLLRYLVQLGIDYYASLKNGNSWPADGGHASGRKWPIIFAGIMLDDPEMKSIGFNTSSSKFGEDCQTFYITQEIIDGYPEYYNTTSNYDPLPQPGDAVYGIRSCQTQYPGTTRYSQGYRECCNPQSWVAEILSAHLMNAKELWNHDALFDFEDWWMDVWVAAEASREGYHDSNWANAMWYKYRDYAWIYCGDGICNGNETFESCAPDCKEQNISENTFYVSVSGSGSHSGSLGNEMNLGEAQAYANSHTNEEITFLLESGEYGIFEDNTERTAWATWKALDYGNKPVFSKIHIENEVSKNVYLRFDGINIISKSGLSYSGAKKGLVYVSASNYVEFLNCIMFHYKRYGGEDVTPYLNGNYLKVDNCDIYSPDPEPSECYTTQPSTTRGIEVWKTCNNVEITNNKIHDLGKSGIYIYSGSKVYNLLIENNTIYNHKGHPPPCDPANPPDYLHGRAIVLENSAGSVIIRNNIMYSYDRGIGMYTYAATNLTIEGNLIYGMSQPVDYKGNGENARGIGSGSKFVNNTIISIYDNKEVKTGYYGCGSYGEAIGGGSPDSSYDGSFELKNNLIIGKVSVPSNIISSGNVIFCPGNAGYNDNSKVYCTSCSQDWGSITNGWDPENDFFVDYSGNDFRPLMSSHICDGSVNGKPEVAVGALPCVCLDDSDCIFGGECVDGECIGEKNCLGTIKSCGSFPDCVNCDLLDGCYGNNYRDYNSCTEGSCDFISYDCSDCSCSCGIYGVNENNYCNDSVDNDCDSCIDNADSDCGGTEVSCSDRTDNDCDQLVDCQDNDCLKDPFCQTAYPSDYISYWKFEENSIDETFVNNGSIQGNSKFVLGMMDQVIAFDGSNDYVDLPNDFLDSYSVGTISAWVKTNASSYQCILCANNGEYKYRSKNEFKVSSDGKINWHTEDVNTGTLIDLSGTTTINDNSWHHVAVVVDNTKTYLYVDGVLDISSSSSYWFNDGVGCTGGTGINYIGALWYGKNSQTGLLDPTWEMKGAIDNVMIYNRALSESEIQQIYCSQGGNCVPFNKFMFVAWGDTKVYYGEKTLIALSNQAKKLNPKFTIYPGDLCSEFTEPLMNVWKNALDGNCSNGILNITFPTRGNHEGTNTPLWQSLFDLAETADNVGATNYRFMQEDTTHSFDYENSHFVGLDYPTSTDKLAWLDEDLTSAEARGLTHAFLFFHVPIYCVGVDSHCRCPNSSGCCNTNVVSIINKHPIVSATFHAHEHMFAYVHMDDTRCPAVTHPWEEFVVATAGAGLYDCNPKRTDYCIETYGFATIDVDGPSFTVNFYKKGSTTPHKTFVFTECDEGEQRLCEKQLGICQGSKENCINNEWLGCDSSIYLNWNSNYEETEVSCGDSYDNDCDGCADGSDPDCGGTETECFDGIDNDCDGLIDCQDSECQVGTETSCTDKIDNDCDGLLDCVDIDCKGMADCPASLEGLVSWYMFEGNANDEMKINDGTLMNGASIVSDAERGNVLSLDGSNDYVDLRIDPMFDYQNLTVCTWINFAAGQEHHAGLVRGGGSNNYFWSLLVRSTQIIMASNRDYAAPRTKASYNDGKWHSVCATRTGKIYVDGYRDATNTLSTIYSVSGNARIGYAKHYFNGLIDDVMIYGRILNQSEIQQIYCSQGGSAEFCVEAPEKLRTNNISQYGITWYFDKEYEYGTFANGDYWVVGPVNIVNIEPEPAFDIIYTEEYCKHNGPASGQVKCANFPMPYQGKYNYTNYCISSKCVYKVRRNGFMINPNTGPGKGHSYDSRAAGFSESLNLGLPISVGINSSVVSTISLGEDISFTSESAEKGKEKLKTAAVLTTLSEPPPADSFRPPYVGTEKPLYLSSDLKRELLPSLIPVDNTPGLSYIAKKFERVWLDHQYDWSGKGIHPKDNMPGYGADIARDVGVGSLMLLLNFSIEEKETLLVRYVQLGIDFYGLLKNGQRWPANGGHMSGRKWPIIFAGIMLDNDDMKNIGNTYPDPATFQEDCQTFYLTQGILNNYPEYYSSKKYYDPLTKEGDPVWGIRACLGDYGQTSYRSCCNSQSWIGEVLSAHIMNAKEFWNHNALFDYEDWWMYVWVAGDPNRKGAHDSAFANTMWDTYRKEYGCIWSYDMANNRYYECSQCQYNCLQSPYCGDGECNGNETNAVCSWDCPCVEEEQRLCEKQMGVCQGSNETCINSEWLGCDGSIYLNWNSNYEENEINCGDSYDNDCDGCTDIIDSNCGGTETSCFDEIDDDCDGFIDCQDSDCQGGTETNCFDGMDDDCDGFTDCQDSECQVGTETSCTDKIDNDCDGLLDCVDIDCKGMADCPASLEGLVSWYMFEEDASDEMGINDGKLMNGASIVSDEERGNVLGLDGSNDYIDLGKNPMFDHQTSVCVWVKYTTDDTGGQGAIIITGGASNTYKWRLNSRYGKIIAVTVTSGSMPRTANTYNDGQWHSICWVRGSRPYVDGIMTTGDSYATSYSMSGNAEIGGGGGRYFNGLLDDVMIFNRSLSETEIQQIYCSQGGSAEFCVEVSSCTNGVKDGTEEGIDCGGNCGFECPTNWNSGISVLFNGTPREDYAEEYFWYDKAVDDHKVVYIKAETPIIMEHNERNLRQRRSSSDNNCTGKITSINNNYFCLDIGANGEDGVPNSGDEGIIRYKVDFYYDYGLWSSISSSTNRYPYYEMPFSFGSIKYVTTEQDSGINVLGSTGDRKGIMDEFGDEWHTISFADDDYWLADKWGEDPGILSVSEKLASDGKSILFVVNPKTPLIAFKTLANDSQYYTTPPNIYRVPKIHTQTTYLTDDVNIELINIMNSDSVYYRFDGQAFQKYTGLINSNSLSNGEHILEYYYDNSYHKTRKIIKNPGYPSAGENHGYLLWKDDAELKGIRERVFSTEPERELYKDYYSSLKSGNPGSSSFGKGERTGEGAINYAFITQIEGINNALDYAYNAKRRLLDNVRKIDPLGFGDITGKPNPTLEIIYRGYYDADIIIDIALTYDLLIGEYKSEDYENGITPIEDYKIRDTLARHVVESLMQLGDYYGLYTTGVSRGWGSARETGSFIAALAMPGYNTNYYGTSGFDGSPAIYEYTPYPDYPVTWKQAFYSEDNKLYGYPNQAHRYGLPHELVNSEPKTREITNIDADLVELKIAPIGSFDEFLKWGYFQWVSMGHIFVIINNVMKIKLNDTYPHFEALFNNSINGKLCLVKVNSLDTIGSNYFPQLCVVNEMYPDLAQTAYDAMIKTENEKGSDDSYSLTSQLRKTGIFGLIWYHDNWQEILTGNPVAKFKATPKAGPSPLDVGFDASSSRDYDGIIASYMWDFGDGASGSGETTAHRYSSEGNYLAVLSVTDNDGKTIRYNMTITVDDSIVPELMFYLNFDNNINDLSKYEFYGSWNPYNKEDYSAGKVGSAGVFNGDSYLNFGVHSEHEGMSELTLMSWVKPSSYGASNQNIISKGNNAYRIRMTTSGKIWYYLKNNQGDTVTATVSSPIIPLNDWTHVVLTYSGSTIKVYANGVSVHSNSWSGEIASPSTNLYIGTYSGTSEFFDGLIDEVKIYDKALSTQEIQEIYCSQGGNAEFCVEAPEKLRTNNISQYGITWYFDKEYEYGTFANGDYWVVGPVNIISITPEWDGKHHGWQVNPLPGSSQGFDYRISTFSSGLVPTLPYTAYPNQSIVKSISIEPLNDTSCRPCLEVAAVLTILEKAPSEGSFRPPYVGTDKISYNVNQLRTDLLPSLEPTSNAPSLSSIKSQFQKVQLDHKLGWTGRFMHPKQNMPDYGSDIAIRNANGALRLMLNDPIEDKMPALINYVQMGIDFYGILKNGGSWPGDGGHQEGRKLPIAFAAVLLDEQEMKNTVSKTGADSKTFGENNGVRFSQKANDGIGIALWAQVDGSEYSYWLKLADNSASGSKTFKDPYGYIDGSQVPGSTYLGCCLSQPWKATSLAVRLMPEVRSVWNDEAFHDFSDRYADFGIWTQPDPCAPPDGSGCCKGPPYDNYTVTFGPDPNNPGECIHDTDESDGIGRAPKSHGKNKDTGSYGSSFANSVWNAYRKTYSCVWAYDAINNWHYDCSQCQYNCLSSPYCGDGFCNGDENPETCLWDCPCIEGEQKSCEKQLGVCQGSKENCINKGWLGCDNLIYLNWNSNYEETEVSCGDSYDNDCDGCTDAIDSDCGGTEVSCSDGVDNDCDGFLDCTDTDCKGTTECLTYLKGIISWYMFEGNANDEMGINDGTLMDGASIVSDVERGSVLSLDGSGDYVSVPAGDGSVFDFGGKNFAFGLWFKTNSNSVGTFVSAYHPSFNDYYRLNILNTGAVQFKYLTGGGDEQKMTSSSKYNDGQWHNVIALRDNPRTGKIYVDGYLVGEDTDNSGSYGAPDIESNLNIGRYADGSNYFNGLMDDVIIYNRTLSEVEIQQIYCSQGGTAEFCGIIYNCTNDIGCLEAGSFCDGNLTYNCTLGTDGCLDRVDGMICGDGLYCNGEETCLDGSCKKIIKAIIDDNIGCTIDNCDEETDTITHTPDDSLCLDGLWCNGAEYCDANLGCKKGVIPNCDDSIGCTIDSCYEGIDLTDNAGECKHDTSGCACSVNSDCNDNNPCTDDICTAQLTCKNTANDKNGCNDGLWCTINDRCFGGDCIADIREVDDGVTCTVDSCDEENDIILHILDNTKCEDGLYCNGQGICDIINDCQAGVAPYIDDNVSCTIDNCDEETDTITHTPDDSLCLDGLWCNGKERCDLVNDCQAGTAPNCDDGVSCTNDVCNENKDSCDYMPNDNHCDDGIFCNGVEYCDVNLDCQNGTSPICDDGIDCTFDYCDYVLNKCVFDDTNCMGKCDITLAYWSTDTAVEGEIVNLIAEGTNCGNKEVNFSIYENDLIPDDYITGFSSVFTKNKSIGWWEARYEPDAGTDPEYYFIANLAEDSSVNKQSDLMIVQKGCKEKWQDVHSICLINDTKMKYYIDKNDCGTTYNLPPDNGTYVNCDYCSEDIEGPFVKQSECINGTVYRTIYYIDTNYLSCCLVTSLDSDCHILNKKYQNKTETVNCEGDDDEDGIGNSIDKCPHTNITKLGMLKPIYTGIDLINIYGCPLPKATKFSPELTTDFKSVDLLNVDNLKLGVIGKGRIEFTENVTLVDIENNYDYTDLDDKVKIQENMISLDSANLPMLNKSAILTLYNLNLTNPKVLKDNSLCSECSIVGYINGTFRFSIEGFTNYSAAEIICGDGDCDITESCSDCSVDCGSCPSLRGGSGGGGIGVREVADIEEGIDTTEACSYDWKCGEWSDCVGGIKTRSCVNMGTCPDDDTTPITTEGCGIRELITTEKEPVGLQRLPMLAVDSEFTEDEIVSRFTINNQGKEAVDGLELELNINYEKTTQILDYIGPLDVENEYIITRYYDTKKLRSGEYTINVRLYRKGVKIDESSKKIVVDKKRGMEVSSVTGGAINIDSLDMKESNKNFIYLILTSLLIVIAIYAKIEEYKTKKRE